MSWSPTFGDRAGTSGAAGVCPASVLRGEEQREGTPAPAAEKAGAQKKELETRPGSDGPVRREETSRDVRLPWKTPPQDLWGRKEGAFSSLRQSYSSLLVSETFAL